MHVCIIIVIKKLEIAQMTVSREVNKYIVIMCEYNAAFKRNRRDVERC